MFRDKTRIALFGVILVLMSTACNPGTIAYFLSPNKMIESKIALSFIFGVRVFLLLAGLAAIFFYRKIELPMLQRVVTNFALMIGSIFLTMVVIEIYLRIAYPNANIPTNRKHDPLFQYHEVFGWQFSPNTIRHSPRPLPKGSTIRINSAGVRRKDDIAIAKPKGGKRIVVLGDSFTSNIDVEEHDIFTSRLCRMLPPNFVVLNFGVNGYGPTQEYLLLRDKAMAYKPDLVIMVIFIGNDFCDVTGYKDWAQNYRRPYARLSKKGDIVFNNIPVSKVQPPARAIIDLEGSRLVNFIGNRLYPSTGAITEPEEVRMFKKQYSRETAQAFLIMNKILELTNNYCKQNGAEFLVVIAPTVAQVNNTYWLDIKKKYQLQDEDYDLFLPNSILTEACHGMNIPILDLTPTLRMHSEKVENIYYPYDWHWNARGNFIIASAIYEYLASTKLLKE